MKVNSRWRVGPSLLFTNLQGNRKIMDRIVSFSKIRKYNIPRIPLIYPPVQSGKSFLFSKLSVEFLFHKHSPSKFIGFFNVLKLSLHFWPQLLLSLSPLKKLKTCSFPAPSTLQRSFSHFLWMELFAAVTIPLPLGCVPGSELLRAVWDRANQCVWAEISVLFASWQFSSPSHLIYSIKTNWSPDKLRSWVHPSLIRGVVVPSSD